MTTELVKQLFPEDALDESVTVEAIIRKLGEDGVQNLAYDGEHGRNPGYIFRGEADFEIPLQSTVERQWRYDQDSLDQLSVDALRKKESLDLVIYCFPCRDLRHPHDLESNKCPRDPTPLSKGVDMNLVIGNQLGLLKAFAGAIPPHGQNHLLGLR